MPERPAPFKYGALLRLRKRQEELCALELAARQSRVNLAVGERAELSREQEHALRQAARLLGDACIDARTLRRYCQYERYLARCGDAKDAEVLQLQERVSEQRDTLIEAVKHRKIVEKLHEKHVLKMSAYYRQMDQVNSDEVSATRAALGGIRNAKDERKSP